MKHKNLYLIVAPMVSLIFLSASLVPIVSHSLGIMRCKPVSMSSSENHHPEMQSHCPPEMAPSTMNDRTSTPRSNCETTLHCICYESPIAVNASPIENHRVLLEQSHQALDFILFTIDFETPDFLPQKELWKPDYSPPPRFIRFQNLLI